MNSPVSLPRAADAGGLRPRVAVAGGAPPSITAPPNSIKPLRHGIDSLYVSYPGLLHDTVAEALEKTKVAAQAPSERELATAFYVLGDHRFAVLPRGRGRFPFVLEDNWFHIQLSNRSAVRLPLAYVQIRSEYLTAVGAEEALETLDALIVQLGEVAGPATISRIDLFVDFVGGGDLPHQPGAAWVKRCRKRDIHEENNRLTGVSFGAGNEVSARLYDKSLEILKSNKGYMRPLWAAAGWQGDHETVWRMEFQTRREALPEPLRGSAIAALPHLATWWRYLTTEWLRLALPSESDDTRSRWPTHPVWEALAGVWDVPPDAPPMVRVTRARLPTDQALFKTGIWGLTSFMAREGITDAGEGLGEFLAAMDRYHAAQPSGEDLPGYLARKARLKSRNFNTALRTRDDED